MAESSVDPEALPSAILPDLIEPTPDEEIASAPAITEERRRAGSMFRALRHRNFRLFAIGQIISLVGTWMQNVALSWLMYRLTHSEWLLGTTWFCTQIPVFALGPVSGLVCDRFSRHRLVVITQIASMIQALMLAALVLSGTEKIWEVLALAIVLGVINAFDIPARQSLIVELAGKQDLLNAISLNSAMFNGARIVGPGIAGILVSGFGEGMCFLLNGISFVAVIACLLAMRLPRREETRHESPWTHLKEGFRFVYAHRAVRLLLLLMALMTTAGMPALVLMPFFAGDIFHRGSQGLGFLMGAMGIGAVIGTLVLARRTEIEGLSRVIFFSSLTLSGCYVAFAWSQWFSLSIAIMLVIGFSVMRQMASANTLIQTVIPDRFRGRTMALYAMTVVGLGPFGSLAAGGLAHQFGPRFTVMLGGLVAVGAALTCGWRLAKVDWLAV